MQYANILKTIKASSDEFHTNVSINGPSILMLYMYIKELCRVHIPNYMYQSVQVIHVM